MLQNVASDPLLTPKEAAHFLRKSVSYLAKCRMYRKGPRYIKIGRSVLYRMSDLIEYLKLCTR